MTRERVHQHVAGGALVVVLTSIRRHGLELCVSTLGTSNGRLEFKAGHQRMLQLAAFGTQVTAMLGINVVAPSCRKRSMVGADCASALGTARSRPAKLGNESTTAIWLCRRESMLGLPSGCRRAAQLGDNRTSSLPSPWTVT
jgi:hypothetical protein